MAVDGPPDALDRRVAEAADLVTVALDALLPRTDGPERQLTEAMRYAALGPGRRLRAFFVFEAARMFNVEDRAVLRAACALECIYAYSRVHDDLPALDDGDERRGRPPVHKAYDEATAVLAGDALQTVAFEIMAPAATHAAPAVRVELVARLAMASGARGLAGGQMLDVLGLGADQRTVARMQRLKTGSLIAFAFEIPLILARAPESERQALRGFAQDMGLAYQIVDDLNDAGIDQKPRKPRPGKGRAGAHALHARSGLVALLGAEAARERVAILAQQCKAHLDIFGLRAAWLRASVDFVLDSPVNVPI